MINEDIIALVENEAIGRLQWAKKLIKNKDKYTLIADHYGFYNFAGYLLVTMFTRPDGETVIYIQDADDWSMELGFANHKAASYVFDTLFKNQPNFNIAFKNKLIGMGFQ